MKTIFSAFFCVLLFTAAALAQSARIESETETIMRPKPTADFKASFTVMRPKIKGFSPAMRATIEKAISYETVMDLNIEEEKADYQWLEEATYEVNHNDNYILNMTLSMQGAAAYPSTFSKTVTIDLKSGNRVKAADLFTDLDGLAKKVKVLQDKEIAETKKELTGEDEKDIAEYFDRSNFTAEELDEFMVNADGITFVYNYSFPHVIMAYEPAGMFKMTWTELKPFIKKDGLLAQFVR